MTPYEIFHIVLSVGTLIFLIIYVRKTCAIAKSGKDSVEQTRKLIEETRISRDEETAPRVIVFFDIHEKILYFVARNIGKSVANNIKISIEPDISSLLDDRNKGKYHKVLFSEGIKMLVPDQEIRTFLNTCPVIYNKKRIIPMTYDIKVSYEGGLFNKQRVYESSVDLEVFADLLYIKKPNIKNIVEELKRIGNILDSIAKKG